MFNTLPEDRDPNRCPNTGIERGPGAGVLLAAGLFLILGLLARDDATAQFWMMALHNASQQWPESLWGALSLLGLGWASVIVACATDRSDHSGRVLLLCLILGGFLTHGLKHWLGEPRPGLVLAGSLQLIGTPILHSGSMPSGHALAAFALCTLLSTRVLNTGAVNASNRLRLLIAASVWGVGVLIALSRIAVGAHWPADVLVGAALGILVTTMSFQLARMLPTHRPGKAPWLPIVLEVSAIIAALRYDEGLASTIWIQWTLASLAALSVGLRLHRWQSLQGRPA